MYPNLNATPLSETSLSDPQHVRLNEINEITGYFVAEIKEKELMSKRLSKYIAFCDYFDKSLIVLSATMVVFLSHHLQQLLEHLRE